MKNLCKTVSFSNKRGHLRTLMYYFSHIKLMLCSVYLLVLVFSTLCITYVSMSMANTSTTNTDVLYTVVILWNKHKKYIQVFPYLLYVRNTTSDCHIRILKA